MRDSRTWMVLWTCGLALLTVECSPKPSQELAVLPFHELELSGSSPGRVVRLPAGAPKAWAAEGYRPWRYIVIHHSATEAGSAALFDKWHRGRGWDELGYHFVIDNGDGAPDGRIEVGRRWTIQKWGAHCGGTPGNEYNNYGIGICLVGDFSRRPPTDRQLASLERLVTCLAVACGIGPERVIGHRDAPNVSTACPGDRLHDHVLRTLRAKVARRLAEGK